MIQVSQRGLGRIPALAILAWAAAVAGCGPANGPPSSPTEPVPVAAETRAIADGWEDDFDADGLDPDRWVVTSAADFRERVVDIIGGRLRLRADTMGTDDSTVKYLGVRSVDAILLAPGTRIAADLDWNDQANGSYLRAGLVIAPEAVTENPLDTDRWIQVEYVGVPPGRNGRLVVAARAGGRLRELYTEGWPARNREGRTLGVQGIEIVIGEGDFQVHENGEPAFRSDPGELTFESGYLYLQMSSHSNYRGREVYFDNVRVSPPLEARR